MRRLSVHLLAILAALGVIAAVGVSWILHLRVAQIYGSTPELIVSAVPIALVSLTSIWLLARALLWRRMQWSLILLLTASIVFAYAVVAIMCGPVACFVPGPYRLSGWFIVGGVALAALTHHLIAEQVRFR